MIQSDAMLLVIEPTELVHVIKNAALTWQNGLQAAKRIQTARRLWQRGEQRAFGRCEIAKRLVKVAGGGGGGSGHEIAEGNAVCVGREHVLAAPGHREAACLQRFDDLDSQRAFAGTRRGVFDELLVDRRGTGDDALGLRIVPGGACDGEGINPTVGEEAFVLGGEHGMNERRRNLRVFYRRRGACAVFVQQMSQRCAIAGKVERGGWRWFRQRLRQRHQPWHTPPACSQQGGGNGETFEPATKHAAFNAI